MGVANTLSRRVREHRKALGLSQHDLAKRARITQPRISQIENGKMDGPLPPRTLRDLADALFVEPTTLIAGDPTYDLPEYVEQGVASGSASTFPGQSIMLFGRERALDEIESLLNSNDIRLVTLTGPGGIGKTHLALRVAMALETATGDPTTVVSLANCLNAAEANSELARGLGIRERGDEPLRSRLLANLRAKPRVIVLDNLEQALPSAATLVADLIAACPGLKFLVTSRARLHVRGEREYAVPPLQLPEQEYESGFDQISGSPAVQLFVARTLAVVAQFELTGENASSVAAICRRLDGLPLAIELAAARMRAYTPAQMLCRLERRLPVLTGGARDLPPRHQTMRGAIGWSYELLKREERALFRQLSVFAGGFTLEAAEIVAGSAAIDDSIASLLEQNLLTGTKFSDDALRFGMLETIREYASEQLAEHREQDDTAGRHMQWCAELAEEAETHLFGAGEPQWLDRLEVEHANLQAALTWAFRHGESMAGTRIALALTDFWYLRGHLSVGRQWLGKALSQIKKRTGEDDDTAIAHIRALACASQLSQPLGDHEAAVLLATESLELSRSRGYRPGIARALVLLANLEHLRHELDRAESHHHEALALFRELGVRSWVVAELNNLGGLAVERGDPNGAQAFADEALMIARESGDAWGASLALRTLGDVSLLRGSSATAATRVAESLDINLRTGNRWGIADSLAAFASISVARGEMENAVQHFASAKALYDQLGIRVPPPLRPDWTEALISARTGVGNERFDAVWQVGLHKSTQGAIADALSRSID